MSLENEDGDDQAAGEYVLGEDISFELKSQAHLSDGDTTLESGAQAKKRKRRKKKKGISSATGELAMITNSLPASAAAAALPQSPSTRTAGVYSALTTPLELRRKLMEWAGNICNTHLQNLETQVKMHSDGRGLTIDNINTADEEELAEVATNALANQMDDHSLAQFQRSSQAEAQVSRSQVPLKLPNMSERAEIDQFWESLTPEARESLTAVDIPQFFESLKSNRYTCKCMLCVAKQKMIDEEMMLLFNDYNRIVKQGSIHDISANLLREHPFTETATITQQKNGDLPYYLLDIDLQPNAPKVPAAKPRVRTKPKSLLSLANVDYTKLPVVHRHLLSELDQKLTAIAGGSLDLRREFVNQIKRINLPEAVAEAEGPDLWSEIGSPDLQMQMLMNLPKLATNMLATELKKTPKPKFDSSCVMPFFDSSVLAPEVVDETNRLLTDSITKGLLIAAQGLLQNNGRELLEYIDSLSNLDCAEVTKQGDDIEDATEAIEATDATEVTEATEENEDEEPFDVPGIEIRFSPRQPSSQRPAPEVPTDGKITEIGNAEEEHVESPVEENYSQEESEDEWPAADEVDPISRMRNRIQEGRQMLRVFSARMFHQRVIHAFREYAAREHQRQLLLEVEALEKVDSKKQLKKEKAKEKKKDKRRESRVRRAEERDKREEEQRLKEELLKAKQEKSRLAQLEHDRLKTEAHRREIEARLEKMKLADEARMKEESLAAKRLSEEKQQQQQQKSIAAAAPSRASVPGTGTTPTTTAAAAAIVTKPQDEQDEVKISRSAQRASAKAAKAAAAAAAAAAANAAVSSVVAGSNHLPAGSKKVTAAAKTKAKSETLKPSPLKTQSNNQISGRIIPEFKPDKKLALSHSMSQESLAQQPLSAQPPHVAQTYYPTAPQFIRQANATRAEQGLAASHQLLNDLSAAVWSTPGAPVPAGSTIGQDHLRAKHAWPISQPASNGSAFAHGGLRSMSPPPVVPANLSSRLFPSASSRPNLGLLSLSSPNGGPGSPSPAPSASPPPVNPNLWGPNPNSFWQQDIPRINSIKSSAIQSYEQLILQGRAVDGFVPAQVLYHSTVKQMGQQLSLNDLFQACGLNSGQASSGARFDCLRDNVGFVTHIRYLHC